MNPRLITFLLAACASALTSCVASYPLGLTKSEWEMLPPSTQAEYRARQKAKDAEEDRIRKTADRAMNESLTTQSSMKQAADHDMYESQKLGLPQP